MNARYSNRTATRRKPTKRAVSLFFKTLSLTLAVCFGLLYSGSMILGHVVSPPEVPPIAPRPNITTLQHPNDPATAEEVVQTAPEGFTDNDRKENFFTFLIVGIDDGIHTDTIMVAAYDGVSAEGHVISIPRDSRVNVGRRPGLRKINQAYPVGRTGGRGHPGGIEQLKQEIQGIIGFRPDFYVAIEMDAFVRAVDTVGGININVPFHMRYDDPCQDLHINISAGTQRLNGDQALNFVRFRRANFGYREITDYGRMENQQQAVQSMLTELLRPANILRIPEFINIFNDNVSTNIAISDMLWFANQLRQVRGVDALSTYTIPTIGTTGYPHFYELLDEKAIVELVNRTINPFTKDIAMADLDIVIQ